MKINKKIIIFAVVILAIELSGYGILTSLFRLLSSIN